MKLSMDPRWPNVGDWFTVPLPDGGVAVGHTVRVVDRVKTLSYFFRSPSDPPTLEACRRLTPAEAVTAKICGGLGIKNGEWVLLGADDVDPTAWPVPEFERVDRNRLGGGSSLAVVTLNSRLSQVSMVEGSMDEAGMRPSDGAAGHVAVQNYLQHLINTGFLTVGQQPWWSRRVGILEPPGVEKSGTEEQAVLLQIPRSWPGNLNRLLRYLRRWLPADSEVDGTMQGTAGTTVYLYGPNADRMADVVSRAAGKRNSLAGAVMEVRRGPPGTEEEVRRL